MALRPIALLGAAAVLAACSASSSSYNMPLDVARSDAAMDDVALIPDTAQPPADARFDVHRGSGPPYPLIFHHGFAGFRDIGPISYYYRVGDDLRGRGETVYETAVAPFASTRERAYALGRVVDQVLAETGAERVVIVAHSQGGLDARYLISSLGYGDRVALAATISTPHRGTRVADAIVGNIPDSADGFIDAIASLLGYTIYQVRDRSDLRGAMESLTESEAVAFNNSNPDDQRVVYWSWAGRSNRRDGTQQCAGAREPNRPDQLDSANPLLYPTATLLEQRDPEVHVNDGLIEVASARWGQFMGCIPADHFDEIGQIAHAGTQPSGFNHIEFYRDVVRRIREAGY